MKKIMLIASLIGGSLLLAGCQKEFGKGGEVRFVASSVAGPQTRAEYSGEGTTSGGLLTWERINWQTGDVLRIWSDAAKTPDNANYSDYKVSSFNVKSRDNTRSQATVENAAEHGLNWDGVTGYCGFWAVYPASMAGTGTTNRVDLSIPGTQTPSDNVLASAPMVAAVNGVEPNSSVTLEFYPAFTAFEITLESADQDITLNSFALTSTSTALSGDYTATITAGGATTYACPSFSSSNGKVEYTFASGTTIAKNSPITFTILALPQELNNLTLEFNVTIGGNTTVRKLALNSGVTETDKDGTPIAFSACSKHRIYGLAMPGDVWKFSIDLDFEVVEWIDGGTSNIDYTEGAAQASYFQFNQNPYSAANSTVDIDSGNWIISFGGSPSKPLSAGVVYVQYSITLPHNAEWSVVPVDPNGYFNVVSIIDGEESPHLNGTVQTVGGGTDVKPIILKITPNMANIPSTRTEDYTMILHTYAVVSGKTVNIDTETQTSDGRYHEARFVIAHNE